MKKTAIAKGSYNGGFPFSRSRPEKGIRIIHDLPIYYNPQYYIMSDVFAIAHIRAQSFTINAKAKLESLPTILFPDESFSLFQTHAMIKRITLILPLLYIKKRENFSEVLAPVSSRFFHLSTVYKKLYSWRRAS